MIVPDHGARDITTYIFLFCIYMATGFDVFLQYDCSLPVWKYSESVLCHPHACKSSLRVCKASQFLRADQLVYRCLLEFFLYPDPFSRLAGVASAVNVHRHLCNYTYTYVYVYIYMHLLLSPSIKDDASATLLSNTHLNALISISRLLRIFIDLSISFYVDLCMYTPDLMVRIWIPISLLCLSALYPHLTLTWPLTIRLSSWWLL